MLRITLPILLAIAGCSKSKSKGDCAAACTHMLELAKADLERSIELMGSAGGEMASKLRAQVAASAKSDLRTCTGKCEEGKLDAACVLAAKSLDGAMTCSGPGTGRTPVDRPAPRSEADWPTATLREVTGSVDGIAFSLQMPSELQVANDTSESDAGWDFPGEPFSQPRFRISVGPETFPKTADEGLAWFSPGKTNEVMKSELAADRYTLVYKSKTFVVVKMLVRAGAKSLECYGTQSSSNGIADPAKLGAWLEKVCATTKPR